MRLFVFILLYLNVQLLPTATAADEKVVTCEYSDTNWEPLGTTLYTCDILTQTIDSQGFTIKLQPGDTERVEGLSFHDNNNLNYLPDNIGEIFPNLKAISGTKSYLSAISSSDFKGLSQLKYINLADTDLKVIEEDTFAGLSELEELDISDCDIRYIDEDAFRGLSSLKTLYIGANKLGSLEPKTFDGLTSLNSLSMELNHLEHIDDNLFATNENLADIWLNGNKIVSLNWKAFESVPQLSYVDLQANPCIDGVFDESNFDELKETLADKCATSFVGKIKEKAKHVLEMFGGGGTDESVRTEFNIDGDADSESFTQVIKFVKSAVAVDVPEEEGQPQEEVLIEFKNDPSTRTVECAVSSVQWKLTDAQLETCDIDNQIIDAKGFKIAPTDGVDGAALKAISFAQNKNIKFLPENIGKFAPNVVEFSARNASLQVLSKKNFAGLRNLRSLNLADNRIRHIDPDAFDDLSALEELDLSGNELEIMDEDVFAKLKNLKTLRLGNNKFHSIHQNLFKNLRNLVNVSISNQQIEKLPERLFNTNTKLENVWVSSNKLKSISPNMFAKLRSLEYLDLRDNKCIDTFYDATKFATMREEILEKCGAGYKLNKGAKSETLKTPKGDKKKGKEKKKKEKLPKVTQPDDSAEEREVTCEYEDVFWPSVNKTLRTCVISEAIDDENYLLNANIMQFDDFSEVAGIQAIQFRSAKFLPKSIADVFPNLIQFSAANAGLTSLSADTFKGLTQLKSLNLSGNKLTALEPAVFKELSSLEELFIDDNEFEEIEEEVFVYFKVLRKLRMKGNRLRVIEESWFEEMPELHDVSFDISDSIHIDSQMFRRNPKLKYVMMNGEFYDSSMAPIDGSLLTDYEPDEIVVVDEKHETESAPETVEISCLSEEEDSPEVCEIDGSQVIDSMHYVIKSSPQYESVEEFVIKGNPNVRYLPQNLGESFPNLKTLRIENSPLSTINRVTFEHMPNLRSIKLMKTNIKSFESDTFDDLPQLEELDLSENPMEITEEGVFDKLRRLKTLNLAHNALHYIHPKTFKFLGSLQSLSLPGNKLSVLDSSVFKNNPDLETIDLEGNPIQNLSPKMFDRLKKLLTVNFSGTQCIDGTFDASQLDALKKAIEEKCEHSAKSTNKEIYCDFKAPHGESADTCVIDDDQVIDERDFKISVDASGVDPLQVTTVSVSNNDKVKFFPANVGEIFTNLLQLNASNNSMSEIPEGAFEKMTNLETLNLSKNKLKSFGPTTFDGLLWLQSLDLSDNDMEEVDEETFAKLPQLRKINISGNKITQISPNAFKHSPQLVEIVMDDIEGFDPEDFDVNDGVEITIISTETVKKAPDSDYEIVEAEREKTDVHTVSESEDDDYSEKVKPEEDRLDEKAKPVDYDYDEKTKSEEDDTKIPDSGSIELDSDELEATVNAPAKEVVCDLETIELTVDDVTRDVLSCVISDQAITDETFKIKPTDYDPQVESVRMDNNKAVKFLPDNIGELFPNLVVLSARNNSITSVPQDSLKSLHSLTTLDLSHNDIVDLDSEMLSDAPVLEEINLSGNKIRELPEEIFFNSPQLKRVNIKHNVMTDISPVIFEKLPNLSTLIIDDGNLTPELDASLQKNNPNIKNLPQKPTTTTTTSTTAEITESSSIIHTPAPPVIVASTTEKSVPTAVPTTSRTTTAKPARRRKVSSTATTTTTTTPLPATVRQIKCDIIYEPSEFLGQSVMKCDISNSEIDDPEVSLQAPPNGAEVAALKLDHNKNIKYLPENIAQVMPNLREVSAKNSAIDAILPGDFEDLTKLESIDLSGNELRSIEPENFDGLKRLRKLDLSDNDIEFVDEDAFNLPQLTELDLDNNEITFLHPKTFRKLPNLQVLSVDGNEIPQLPEDIFNRNPRLKNFKHSVKNFVMPTFATTTKSPVRIMTTFSKYVPTLRPQVPTQRPQLLPTLRPQLPTLVPQVPSEIDWRGRMPLAQKQVECEYGNIHWTFSDDELFTCDLKDAVIDDPNYMIKPSTRNRRVKGLSFVDNKNLKFLPKNIAHEFPNLVEISAFNTSLNNVPNGALNNITRLRNLQLMSSDISSIDPQAFENLPSLESLDLSNNNLYDLPSEALKSVPSLKSLYMANNNLRHLDPKMFENVPDLRNISLENNKLPSIDRKLFGTNYELQNVWLNGNRINAIDPTIFDGKRALEYVDLRGNDCIDEFFEAYGIEGIRNKLRNSCKGTEEPSFVPRTTARAKQIDYETTVKPRPLYTTDRSVKSTTGRQQPVEITTRRGPQTFISQPQRPATTTASPPKEVKCTFSYHDYPNEPSPLYTCFINDQPIKDTGFFIKSAPANNFVSGLVIDDSSSSVNYLPENIGKVFPNLRHLSARNNSINNMPRDALDGLQNLRNLDLSDNNLSVIDRETFSNLPSLEELNLSGNNVPHIYNETFAYLPRLRDLDLSRNEIDTIDPGVFNSMPALEKLSLENNEIAELPENVFRGNPKLESVNLSGNKIRSLHPEIFENLPQLKEVNLDENGCINGHFKDGAFYAMKYDIRRNCLPEHYQSLQQQPEVISEAPIINQVETSGADGVECEFSDTYSPATEDYLTSCLVGREKDIEDPGEWKIKDTPSNRRVKRFVVDGNKKVNTLPTNLPESFPELTELVATNVPLKSITPGDFRNMNKLTTVTVSNTSVKDIEPATFAGAPDLQTLDLSNNNLRHIDDDSFSGIPKLKTLDLSGNKIPKLSSEAFASLPQLTTVRLTGNDLHTIDGDVFKRNPKLYTINLDDNNLKTIDPTAFDRLPQLIHLDLSKNECIDRSFGTSTMHLMRKIVNENCLPYKALKNELRACKKEVESCRAPSKAGETRSNGDDGLRDALQKAESKIRQLNLQINKLRSSLSDEKDLLGKEMEKSRGLQKKLDQMKHKCARIDENHNFLIDLNCEFHDDDNKYACFARNLKIAAENTSVDDTKGDHKPNKGKYDVDSLVISNQHMRFLPTDIANQFPYLKELIIDNSKLASIGGAALKNLPHLTRLVVKGNDIESISPHAFDALPQLEELELEKNNLRELPVGVFEKLPNLKVLNLNDNALLSLPHDILPRANSVRKFMVSRNNLNSIDPRLFPKLRNAEVIDFTNNKCVDEKFDANVDDKSINFMAFIGGVNMKCINNGDDDDDASEDGFCKGRKAP